MKFRDLKASEIEVRIQSAKEKGVVLLLYKDARVDMNVLDETIGPERWQREHYECKGNLFCRVGIQMDDGSWVWKSDCGTESNTEAQKGEASDSFKRACFNWGIGRELYTSPFVWVPADKCNIKNNNGRYACYDRFRVSSITIEDKVITGLSIINENTGRVAFTYGKNTASDNAPAPSQPPAELDKVICPQCGKQVLSKADKDGKMHTAAEVLRMCGGVCVECGRAKHMQKNADSATI